MYAPLPKSIYYAVCFVQVVFCHEITGEEKTVTGTGVFLTGRNNLFIATVRHNVDYSFYFRRAEFHKLRESEHYKIAHFRVRSWGDSCISSSIPIRSGTKQNKWLTVAVNDIKFPDSEEMDVALIHVNVVPETLEENSTWSPATLGFLDVANDDDFERTNPGDRVLAVGFPKGSDLEGFLPLARGGIFATDPAVDYRDMHEEKSKCFAIEIFSSPGLSGSPVFALERPPLVVDVQISDANRHDLLRLECKKTQNRRAYLAGFVSRHYSFSDETIRMPSMNAMLARCEKSSVLPEMFHQFAL